jgi:FAD/FMN-containing dehydrogenase
LLKKGALLGSAMAASGRAFLVAARGLAASVDPAATGKFRASLKGRLILPGDKEYESARRVWNWRYDEHPAMIARCASAADVRRSVDFARKQDLRVAVRSGGHSFAGFSTCNDGLVIDLSRMQTVKLDSARRVARAEPGIRITEFDNLAARAGLAASLGVCPDVAVGGLTLGGGNGWLEGVYGTACDNLDSVELVTADGELLRADSAERADLFWAMRGAGPNFGVATRLEYRLHPVTTVMFGAFEYQPSQARPVMRFLREFAMRAPDQLSLVIEVPGQWGDSGMELAVVYVGDSKAAQPLIKELRDATKPTAGEIQSIAYKDTVGSEAPPGGPFSSHRKHGFFPQLSDEVIDAVCESVKTRPSKWSKVDLFFAHGERCRIDPRATAYSLRQVGFECWAQSYWTNPGDAAKSVDWVDRFWKRNQVHANGRVYVNYLEDEGEARVRAAYGPNYDRLVRIKNKYDPTNFFRLNQNVKPTA